MVLDVKKIYVDTRFVTKDSKSTTDFTVELPRTINTPDKCIAYIDEVVIPVSWYSIDYRNNKLYLRLTYNRTTEYLIITIPPQNYTGATFATALETALNNAVIGKQMHFTVSYDDLQKRITRTCADSRNPIKPELGEIVAQIVSDTDLTNDNGVWNTVLDPLFMNSINNVIKVSTSYNMMVGQPFYSYVDLHTTRNLYLHSSALSP